MNLESVATELYRAPLSEFIRTRSAAVTAAKDAGDKELARRIGKLPKPSVAAWLANLLVTTHRDEIDKLIALGKDLRAAEQARETGDLRRLGRERQHLIRAVSRLGVETGAKVGTKASPSAVRELEQTLQASLADSAAADAVLTAVLVRSLTSNGVEPVDLSGALAVDSVTAAPSSSRDDPPRLRAVDTTAAQRDLAEARRKLEDAEQRADDADEALEGIQSRISTLAPEIDALTGERRHLRSRLAEIDSELADRTAEHESLRKNVAGARHEADVAARALSRARERAERLSGGASND
ncbi:hypothetical protein [Mycetocola zhujimingii]|uniref:Uncharacterized protein n=1 Tax=Mycetocola zhujimingii TaxID=2079792 RepID=A0A2U1TGK3_9MICO|nr:hypothetical protein [Mycetocola zhujimingii]PWC07960.1 hypothetical protein DF223_00950 [Mycetocola zhujimingii]